MELTVRERLVLLGMLPKEANFITLRLMRVLKEDLSFSDDENEKLKFVQLGESLKWDEKEADKVVKEMEIGETMMNAVTLAISSTNGNRMAIHSSNATAPLRPSGRD